MSSMHRDLRALADRLTPATHPSTQLAFANGIIVDITAGVLSVTVLGSTVQAPYYGDTPAIDDTVGVLFIAGSPVILGVPRGVPPITPTA